MSEFSAFNILTLLFGAYLLISAIVKKGGFFEIKHLKCSQRKYYTVTCIILFAASFMLIAQGLISGLKPFTGAGTVSKILLICAAALLILLLIFNMRMTDKAEESKRKD